MNAGQKVRRARGRIGGCEAVLRLMKRVPAAQGRNAGQRERRVYAITLHSTQLEITGTECRTEDEAGGSCGTWAECKTEGEAGTPCTAPSSCFTASIDIKPGKQYNNNRRQGDQNT